MTATRRALFPWPDWAGASSTVVALVRSAEDHLARAPADSSVQVMGWLRGDPLASGRSYPPELGLAHPLAPWFAAQQDVTREGRSLREWAVVDRFGERLVDTIAAGDLDDFVRGLATLATHGVQRPIRPRTRAIGTRSDQRGDRVVFPSSALVRDRLALIQGELRTTQSPWLYRAVVGMAAISNCHPFDDGNGRTSRMVFNALIRRGARRSDLYVPLHEFAALSGGSLTLAVREAELRGQWETLFRFVERCLFLVATGVPRLSDLTSVDPQSA